MRLVVVVDLPNLPDEGAETEIIEAYEPVVRSLRELPQLRDHPGAQMHLAIRERADAVVSVVTEGD